LPATLKVAFRIYCNLQPPFMEESGPIKTELRGLGRPWFARIVSASNSPIRSAWDAANLRHGRHRTFTPQDALLRDDLN
jgi:hypothetical protein